MFFDATTLQVSAAALVTLVVILVLTGRLVPRRVVEDLRSDRDAQLAAARAEAATWQRAYEIEQHARRVQAEQIEALLEVGRTTSRVLGVLPAVAAAIEEKPHEAA